jgi:hypothetical protein
MTNRDVALLAFKVVGLWLVATAALSVAGIPCWWWDPSLEEVRATTVLFTLLPAVVAVGIGVPVWFGADWLAARIFPAASPAPTRQDRPRAEPLFALALSTIGVLFICEAVPTLVNAVALFGQSRHLGRTVLGDDIDQQRLLWNETAKANATAGVARLVIGIALLAGPARLSALSARARQELRGTLTTDEQEKDRGGVE